MATKQNDFDNDLNDLDPADDPANQDDNTVPAYDPATSEPDLTTGPNAADQDNGAFESDPAGQIDPDDITNSDEGVTDGAGGALPTNPDEAVDDDDSDDDSDEDAPQSNIPGQLPEDADPQYDDQTTRIHQALLYQVRSLQELSTYVSESDTNYSALAVELKSFFSTFVGRLETVWQNGGVNQSQADSLPPNTQDPYQRHRSVY